MCATAIVAPETEALVRSAGGYAIRLACGLAAPCPACGAPPGAFHHPGCPEEPCPLCDRHAVGCTHTILSAFHLLAGISKPMRSN